MTPYTPGGGGHGCLIISYPSNTATPIRGGIENIVGANKVHTFYGPNAINYFTGFLSVGVGSTFDTSLGMVGSNVMFSFSADGLTATRGAYSAGSWGYTRSIGAPNFGKWYAEVKFNSAGVPANVGVMVTSPNHQITMGSGPGAQGVGIAGNGSGLNQNVAWATAAPDLAWTDGTWVFVAVDAAAKLVWFKKQGGAYWNNNSSADPATGVGGLLLDYNFAPYTGVYLNCGCNGAGKTATINFGKTAFVGAVPSGFSAWG